MQMKICIVNFSGRVSGNCKRITNFICEKYEGEDLKRFDFDGIILTPYGKCNAECFQIRESCPYFAEESYKIYDSITNSDLAYFILPNYCDYPCANQANFLKAFEYQINEGEKPDALFLSAKRYGKRSIDGNLTDSLNALRDIENFILKN